MRWASLVLLAAVTAAPYPVLAQSDFYRGRPPLTDGEKRRLHRPSVIAATDCVAQAALMVPAGAQAAQDGRYVDLIEATATRCLGPLNRMMDEHDRIYGPGTGRDFFDRAYGPDLPRAVMARIQPELARRQVEAERVEQARRAEIALQEARRQTEIAAAERADVLLRERMTACLAREVTSVVRSAEPAEILATATMTICSRETADAVEGTLAVARARFAPLSAETENRIRDELRAMFRRAAIAGAVRAKADLAAEAARPATPPMAVQPAAQAATSPVKTCLTTMASVRKGQLVDRDKLLGLMLELCRPEIEGAARTAFLGDTSVSLDQVRARTLEQALADAKDMLGVTTP